MRTGRRWLGLLGPFGSVAAIVGAVVATRRSGAGVGGYLSELGAFGERGADAFRLGLAAGAVSCIAVAAALTARRPWRDSRVVGLLAAAGLVATQTIVRCTTGCPLPIADGLVPIEDTAHFVIAAAGFATWMMVASVDSMADDALCKQWSRFTAAAILGHLAVLGALVLAAPHASLAGLLQRSMTLIALAWVARVGIAACRVRAEPRPFFGLWATKSAPNDQRTAERRR